jgi:hypothetical protein
LAKGLETCSVKVSKNSNAVVGRIKNMPFVLMNCHQLKQTAIHQTKDQKTKTKTRQIDFSR